MRRKQWQRIFILWGILLWSLSRCTTMQAHERRPIPMPANKRGVHLLLDDGRNHWPTDLWREHVRLAREAVGEWGYVTQLVRLDDLNLAKWQHFMDLCAELHLTPILRLATTFDEAAGWWVQPPLDRDGQHYQKVAQQYANFVARLKWPTEAHYIVVGNEPNHGDEWQGRPSPTAYGRFLLDTAIALHRADPQARVLNAPLDLFTPHTGSHPFVNGMWYIDAESFLDEMVTAHPTIFDHLDAWASHPYPLGPFTQDPDEQAYGFDRLNDAANLSSQPPPVGIYNRGVNGYAWELWKLSTYGVPPLPVFITETGWRHEETAVHTTLDHMPNLPRAAVAASYLQRAFYGPGNGWVPWQRDERVVAVTPFAFNGVPTEWGHTNWLILNENGRVTGTYSLFESWPSP